MNPRIAVLPTTFLSCWDALSDPLLFSCMSCWSTLVYGRLGLPATKIDLAFLAVCTWFSHLDALLKGSAENARSPLYTVGLRYIKCPCIRLGPDNINHPFLRFGPDNINHPFLCFGPDISTTLCYASAKINQMPFCTLRPKNIYYYLCNHVTQE